MLCETVLLVVRITLSLLMNFPADFDVRFPTRTPMMSAALTYGRFVVWCVGLPRKISRPFAKC